MTEKDIIRAINTIADNHEQGGKTDADIVSEELRTAIARLYTIGYRKGFEEAKGIYGNADSVAIKAAKERIEKECRKDYEERLERIQEESRERLSDIEKRHEKAAELIKLALEQIDKNL